MLSFLLAHFQYPNFFKGPYDIWTSGTFKDGNIKFIGEEGNRRQESPEELGLDSKKMNKGDKVSIYLDKYGRILAAQVDNFWTKFFLFMGPFYISPVFIVLGIIFLWMMIGRFTFSSSFYRWKAKVNSGKYERSL